jgi:hypothetical protein
MRLAASLRRLGVATPALMLVEMLAPVGHIAADMVKALGPLLPFRTWHSTAATLAGALRDAPSRDLLLQLLED